MGQTPSAIHEEPSSRPLLSAMSLLIAGAMIMAIIIGMISGMAMHWKGQVAMLILASIPICTIGTAFALAGLIWRKENKSMGQFGLWINGMLGFFGFPLLCFWLLWT